MLGFLRRSVDEFGQTIVMVTHDAHAAAYADRVVFLADGAVVDELLDPDAPAILDRMMTFEQAPGAHGPARGGASTRRRTRRPSRPERMLKATWRSLMAHKARMLLSGLAVVLGVAFVVGTFIFTDTLKGTFDELFSAEAAGRGRQPAAPAARDDEGTGSVVSVVPQSVLDNIRRLP